MKNFLSKALIVLAVLGITSQAQAYRYSFTNHTSERIIVGMRYCAAAEYVEFISLEPNESEAFVPGRGSAPDKVHGGLKYTAIGGGKAGYVGCEFYYINQKFGASLKMTTQNQNTVPWRAISITWIPSESYEIALDLARSIGETGEAAGKTAAKAAATYVTGGAAGIGDAAQQALQAAKGDALKEAASGELGLGALLNAVGKSAARSMLVNRHIDIIEDETGSIKFISLL